jgi:hypothetical protein
MSLPTSLTTPAATRVPRARTAAPFAALAALALTTFAAVLAPAPAHAVLVAIERAFETSSADLKLPENPGRFSAPNCGKGCPGMLELTAATTYSIHQRPATLKALRDYLAQKQVTFTLYFDPKSGVVNRVSAD